MPTLTIVSPFYNEAAPAAQFCSMLERLETEVKRRYSLLVDKVLIDDGSTDGSAETFASMLSGRWKILRLSRNFGKEYALLAGIDHAKGDLVLLLDADLQHSLEVCMTLIGEILADPEMDVVYAVRSDRRETGWRRAGMARLFYRLINLGQRYKVPENAGDFRVMRRRAVDAFAQLRDRRRFNKGLFAWIGFRQKAIEYRPAERAAGNTKWSRRGLFALSVEGITSFSAVPLRLVSGAGLVVALAGMLYGVKIVLEVLFHGIDVPGFPSLFVAVTILGGFNLALLGLVGEYVWVALSESKDRPIYVVRDILEPGRTGRSAL
ncbi:glycosyltransferase family 2 protein [Mesorhizobium xinjiangense]|uniref:glycosyltransferase family 2 protein n=1 Tax=Mesorhizobium xinjiangense TaxID=2678685 RepID=UPI0012EDC50D|nr:glycosyltransferase family 2 protein [Mesorhizobium xinjiangense]